MVFPWFFPWSETNVERASSCICQRSALRSSSNASGHAGVDEVMVRPMAVATLMALHRSPGSDVKRMGRFYGNF